MDRREFLAVVTGGMAAAGAVSVISPRAGASEPVADDGGQIGVLVDTTKCIGCRKCEFACARANRNPGEIDVKAYNDMSVLNAPRRMTPDALTVVNKYPNAADPEHPYYVKIQCMHCVRPNCVSACIVGALHRETNGTVSYDAGKCIGCRYCMLACPFEVPTYEYDVVYTPRVSKCTFCHDTFQVRGEPPACVQMCPTNVFTYAPRKDLLLLAHEKIGADPAAYHDRVYGETEAGGTAWLYLTSKPPAELGLFDLPGNPLPALTESIQHGIFKYGIPPMLLYGLLTLAMKVSAPDNE